MTSQSAASKPTFDMNLHIHRLMLREPFFAAISRRMNKIPSTAIPTAGVRVNPDSLALEMLYNPSFFDKLVTDHAAYVDGMKAKDRKGYIASHPGDVAGEVDPFVWVRGVLLHELYHIVFGHVSERLPVEGMTKKWNHATDLAINSNLQGQLPDYCLMPGVAPYENMPHGMSADFYFRSIVDPENQKKQGGKGDNGDGDPQSGEGQPQSGNGQGQPGDGQIDDHSGWGDLPDDIKEAAKEAMRQITEQAVNEASANSQGWGSVSASMRDKILDSIRVKVNWRAHLRYFVKTSQKADKRTSVYRINKRFQFIHPGKKSSRTAKIAISIDQSGSVSDELLTAFFSQLDSLAQIAEFTVVPFDTRVDDTKVYTWKKGQHRKAERVLCGGTDFNAPTRWVNERNFDGHIILTDLEAPLPVRSSCQRMWMTDKNSYNRRSFNTNERIIVIE